METKIIEKTQEEGMVRITTKHSDTVVTVTLKELQERLENRKAVRANMLEFHTRDLTPLEAEIADLEHAINEAREAGVIVPVAEEVEEEIIPE